MVFPGHDTRILEKQNSLQMSQVLPEWADESLGGFAFQGFDNARWNTL
jgi:hypothetical protein